MLGAVLVDNAAFNSAAELLTRDDFYREAHRRIFDAMAAPVGAQPADRPRHAQGRAVARVGAGGGRRRRLPGRPARRPAAASPTSSTGAASSRRRRSSGTSSTRATASSQSAYEAEDEAAVLLDRAEKAIFDIAERRIRQGFVGIREIVKESFRTIDQLSQSRELVTGLPTGFVDLDEMTSGLQKGDLIIVAARPAMGKTSLLPERRAVRVAQDGRDGGHLLARDVEGAAGAAHALRRRARRLAPAAHGEPAGEGLGAPGQGLRGPVVGPRSSSTTRPRSPRSRCARSAAA